MKKGVAVSVLGRNLMVRAETDEGFVREVEAYVNRKLEEAGRSVQQASEVNVLLLTCLNIAGEHLRARRDCHGNKLKLRERVQSLIQKFTEGENPRLAGCASVAL